MNQAVIVILIAGFSLVACGSGDEVRETTEGGALTGAVGGGATTAKEIAAGAMTGDVTKQLFQYDIERAESYFEEFIFEFNRNYTNADEKQMRFEIFKQSLMKVNEMIRKAGKNMFVINEFSDYMPQEKRRRFPPIPKYYGYFCSGRAEDKDKNEDESREVNYVDWTSQGLVTSVKNQGKCGSCWAFAATGVVEGAYAKKTGQLKDLSEQELVDCSSYFKDCSTGAPLGAGIKYVIDNGVTTSAEYPYTSGTSLQVGPCRTGTSRAVQIRGCVEHTISDEEGQLKSLVASKGPMAIALYASSPEFESYKGPDVLENCPGGDINHAVLLVGFGEENGVPYWKIKNSWGTQWGDQGYIKVRRGVNACSMTSHEAIEALA